MTALDTLPDDIIWDIASKLHTPDNKRLRLVCRALSKLVARFALASLAINVDMLSYPVTKEKLEAYSRRETEGVVWVRTLTIYSLAHSRRVPFGEEQRQMTVRRLQRDHELREDLSAALTQLDLHTFGWSTSLQDPDWASEVISRHLSTHPVRNLFLEFNGGISTRNSVLDGVGHLQELVVSNIYRGHALEPQRDVLLGHPVLLASISKIIQHSPGLTRLTIHSGHWLPSPDNPPPTFHQFLTSNTILKLKMLDLCSLRITMDDITTPYFRSLEHLSIRYDFTPDSKIRAEFDELWKTLRREQIRLRRVETDTNAVSAEFLKYLEYCNETLTDLLLREKDYSGPEPVPDNNSATMFYGQTLPQLAGHIKVLFIQTTQKNEWCFGWGNAEAIGKCIKLNKLAVSIVELHQNHSVHVRNLLEETAAKLPTHLELVTFNVYQMPQIA